MKKNRKKNVTRTPISVLIMLVLAAVLICTVSLPVYASADELDGTIGGGGLADNTDGTAGGGGLTDDTDGTIGGGELADDTDGTIGGGRLADDTDGTAGGGGLADDTDGTAGGGGLADDADGEASENAFDVLWQAVSEHVGEIFSTLAFAGSLIIMFCYKKGLLPIVRDGILQLAGGVKSLGEHTDAVSASAASLERLLADEIARQEATLLTMERTLAALEGKLGGIEERDGEIAAFRTVMTHEVDMLHDIFMAAAMPQYMKDKVGAATAEMKAALAEGGKHEPKE